MNRQTATRVQFVWKAFVFKRATTTAIAKRAIHVDRSVHAFLERVNASTTNYLCATVRTSIMIRVIAALVVDNACTPMPLVSAAKERAV